MASGIQIDARAFEAAYEELMARWKVNFRSAGRRYAHAAAESMRRRIHSESGELAGSVKVVDTEDGNLEVGAFENGLDPHGLFVEFGTSKMAAEPWARPALEEAKLDFHIDP